MLSFFWKPYPFALPCQLHSDWFWSFVRGCGAIRGSCSPLCTIKMLPNEQECCNHHFFLAKLTGYSCAYFFFPKLISRGHPTHSFLMNKFSLIKKPKECCHFLIALQLFNLSPVHGGYWITFCLHLKKRPKRSMTILSTPALGCIIEEETLVPGSDSSLKWTCSAPHLNYFDTERWKFRSFITTYSINSFRQLVWQINLAFHFSRIVSDSSMSH